MSEKPCIDNACGYCKFLEEEVRALKAQRDELLEALELADALLSGANMNKNVVEKKVKTTIAKAKGE